MSAFVALPLTSSIFSALYRLELNEGCQCMCTRRHVRTAMFRGCLRGISQTQSLHIMVLSWYLSTYNATVVALNAENALCSLCRSGLTGVGGREALLARARAGLTDRVDM